MEVLKRFTRGLLMSAEDCIRSEEVYGGLQEAYNRPACRLKWFTGVFKMFTTGLHEVYKRFTRSSKRSVW